MDATFRVFECQNARVSMSGVCFTYLATDSELTVEEWAEVCMDEREHPAPEGLHAWHKAAMEALQHYRPSLQEVESLEYFDGTGPVYFITGGGDIQMKPVKRYTPSAGVDEFAEWWGYCTAIVSAGPTFVYDLDFYQVLDIGIDVERARSVYRHLL